MCFALLRKGIREELPGEPVEALLDTGDDA
jgi:hypothetical protein